MTLTPLYAEKSVLQVGVTPLRYQKSQIWRLYLRQLFHKWCYLSFIQPKKHQITTDHLLTLRFWTTNNCFNMKYWDHTLHRNFVWTSHNTYDVNYVIYFNIIIPDVSCQCVKKVWNAILELQSSSILKIMFIISDTQSPSSCVSSGVSLYAVIIFHVWTIIYWCRKLVSFVSPLVYFLFCPCHVPTTTYYLKIYTKF